LLVVLSGPVSTAGRPSGGNGLKGKVPRKPKCAKCQGVTCKCQPSRNLLPLWRTEEAYAALQVSHQNYERKRGDLRIQYLLGPGGLAIRPKRLIEFSPTCGRSALVSSLCRTPRTLWLGMRGEPPWGVMVLNRVPG
jgi:hypothetical protein